MKRFKKVYIEITNICNLNCSFCSISTRKKKEMPVDEFSHVLNEVKNYSDYIYLHVKGEPLCHSKIDDILTICDAYKIRVNITTNGTLIKEKYNILNDHPSIRQLNISLHSENEKLNYLDEVLHNAKSLSGKMYISYRFWTLKENKLDEKSTTVVDKIVKHYNLSGDIVDNLYHMRQIKIAANTYVNKDNRFEWPSLDDQELENGYCYGLIDQLAILVDGTIVPCCLDAEGIIDLGNIFKTPLAEILETERVRRIAEGFKSNKCIEAFCRRCTFKSRFKKKIL